MTGAEGIAADVAEPSAMAERVDDRAWPTVRL